MDPFDAQAASERQNGSSVNTLSIVGYSILSLSDDIVITLPLPSSASDETWDLQSYGVNCTEKTNATVTFTFSRQEVDRAQYCGFSLGTGSDDDEDSGDGKNV